MINYTDTENILDLLYIEKSSLKSTLDIQNNLNKQILTFMKNFLGKLDVNSSTSSDVLNYINKSTIALKKSNNNIEALKKLLSRIDKIACLYKDSESKVEDKIKNYNKTFSKAINIIYKNTSTIEKFLYEISLIDFSNFSLETEKLETTETEENLILAENELNLAYVENTLVISEMQGTVILPYKMEDVKNKLTENKNTYSSIEDVIQKAYTFPIKKYKSSAMSRFKEAYKLITKKEHKSKIKALSLGFELFFNYNLHPAIITACNSLDELDIYLACLEDNTLEDFKFFKIKYEIAPVVKNKSESTFDLQ